MNAASRLHDREVLGGKRRRRPGVEQRLLGRQLSLENLDDLGGKPGEGIEFAMATRSEQLDEPGIRQKKARSSSRLPPVSTALPG
jgi:hypothetical protein